MQFLSGPTDHQFIMGSTDTGHGQVLDDVDIMAGWDAHEAATTTVATGAPQEMPLAAPVDFADDGITIEIGEGEGVCDVCDASFQDPFSI